jgi:hypothetical protein
MDQLWQGTARFQNIVNMQIQTVPDNGAPFVTGMNAGTQIVPMNGVWYLFNRESNYAPPSPLCPPGMARIVVRKSTDRGKTWSKEVVIASPDGAKHECTLADGHAFWDAETKTWHYLAQMLSSEKRWNVDHFRRQGSDPMGKFSADPANPVMQHGSLWNKICGPSKSCPRGTTDEGTPEISFKSKGFYYVTFHGARIGEGTPPTITGYRGLAKTRDFRNWITSDKDVPNDAIWSPKDCEGWNVSWSPKTGCIGGGHAGTLITSRYTYMLIESADISLDCMPGQNWVAGLARAPVYRASGNWEQLPSNPLLKNDNGTLCAIQYPRLFKDAGHIYLTYWTLGRGGFQDPNTFFHIARLQPL